MNHADGKQILLVEDEALIAMSERLTLERHGYKVLHASTGEKAVEVAATTTDLDLVLMDINLGSGIDGTEAAARILAARDLPVVFCSSHTDPAVVEKTEKITSYGYIVKNAGETVLTTSIKMAFRLFESRKLAADTFDYSINGLCVHRLLYDDAGTPYDCEYLKVNEAFEHHTGLSVQEIVGRTIRDLYSQDEAREIITLYAEVVTTQQSIRKTIRFEPTDRWYTLNAFPTQGDEFTVVVENVSEQILANERLADEKERLRVTLQSVGDAVIATDADGRITLLNSVAEQLTGYPRDEAVGLPLSNVFHILNSRTRERCPDPVSRVLEDGAVVGLANHTVLVASDGHDYQIADSAAPIRDTSGAIIGVVLVFRDVTVEYAIQQELRSRERDMKRAQEMASLGSWRIHLDSGAITASPEAHRIYGLGECLLTLELIQSIPLPHYRDLLNRTLRRLIDYGEGYDVEFELRRVSDDALRYVHSVAEYDAERKMVVGTIQDITERKRAEETLRAERERFATITELSPVGIVTVDAGGVISYANSAAERILGLHRSEITNLTYDAPAWQHTSPDGGPFPDEEQPFSIVMRTLEPVYNVCHGITWSDGRHVELSINGSPIIDGDGQFQGMVATIEDITNRYSETLD